MFTEELDKFGYDEAMLYRSCLSFLLLPLLLGCANKQLKPYLDNYKSFQEQIFVIDHGYHTALVIETEDLAKKIGLQDTTLKNYRYIEIGFGDAAFYQEEEEQFTTILAALFFSTPAVLHMRAYNNRPDLRFPKSQTFKIKLSRVAMEKLLSEVAASFELDKGRVIKVAKSSDAASGFFKSRGTYHMFYTCNNWTAEMMQKADYPISHRWSFFSGSVMRQIESVQRQLGLTCDKNSEPQCHAIDEDVRTNSR